MSNKIGPVYKSGVARSTPFDNSSNGFTSTEVQSAIEELQYNLSNSASPGFTYGRSGNLPQSTWLLDDTVPSNKSGRVNFLNNCIIRKCFIANEDPTIIKVGIYTHDGDEVNLTLINTVTTLAQRTNYFDLSVPVPINKQIAIRIQSDSPNSAKNMDVGLLLQGNLV